MGLFQKNMHPLFEMNQYLIQEKFLKIFGGRFWFKDMGGNVVAYCKQKAFRLKEDITLYTDETCTTPLLHIKARNVIDFSATYDIIDAETGQILGAAQRKGWKSLVKDTWKLLDTNGNQYGQLIEDSNALIRRFVPGGKFVPARFHIEIPNTAEITLNQLFNPFIRRTVVSIPQDHSIDRRVLAGIALLNAAIEGRQS